MLKHLQSESIVRSTWPRIMLPLEGSSMLGIARLSISLVFATAAVLLFAELAFGRRLRVVYAMLHRFCCAKKGEDRLEVVIG